MLIAYLAKKLTFARAGPTKEDLARLDALMPRGAAAGAHTRDMDRVNI